MFHDPRDINRDLGYRDPARDDYLKMGEGSGYALPLSLFAIVFIIGALILFAPTTNQQTASNAPRVETTCAGAVRNADPAAGHGAEAVAFSISVRRQPRFGGAALLSGFRWQEAHAEMFCVSPRDRTPPPHLRVDFR